MRTLTSFPRIHADERGLIHSELSGRVIGIFYEVYNELGHGFLESVYEQALSIALAEQGIFFQRQVAIPVWFRGHQIGDFRADLLVDNKVIVELKAGRAIEPAVGKAAAELSSRHGNRSRTVTEISVLARSFDAWFLKTKENKSASIRVNRRK